MNVRFPPIADVQHRRLTRLYEYGAERSLRPSKKALAAPSPTDDGVKVMLFGPSGEIMLIRNSYGRSDLFVMPGGGIRVFEAPAQAAEREIREELGCKVADLRLVSTHFSRAEGKRDTIYLFKAVVVGEPRADPREVEEARFFPLSALPPNLSPATRRRIQEQAGVQTADGTW